MAVIIKTENPEEFLSIMRDSIVNGLIPTWIIDNDGDLTSSNLKWRNKAWFEPIIDEDKSDILAFGIIPSTIWPMTDELYGVYHGRLVATLVAYFSHELSEAVSVTPDFDDKYDKHAIQNLKTNN